MQPKQNKPKQQQPTVKVVVEEKKVNAPKVSKNQRRKANQRARAGQGLMASIMSREVDLERSVKQGIQTLFRPQSGLHRPYKTGFETTALIGWKGSYTFSQTSPALDTMNIQFWPSQPEGTLVYVRNSTGILDPVGTNQGTADGPFKTTNPAASYRVISAEFVITWATQVTSISGAGEVFYVPSSNSFTLSRPAIDQLEWSQPIDGAAPIVLHWVPNTYETDFIKTGATYPAQSYFGLYLTAPTTNMANVAFKIDWTIGIEYIPTTAYRPYVMRSVHSALPETNHYVSKAIQQYWNPWVINVGGKAGLDDQGVGGHSIFEPSGLIGDNNPGQAMDEDAFDEEEKADNSGPNIGRLAMAGLESALTGSPLRIAKEVVDQVLTAKKPGRGGNL